MNRGNSGEALFRDDTDRRRFLGLVSVLPERFSLEDHTLVLMNNHDHLLLRCREANLSEVICWLQVSNAERFNWADRRRGREFQEAQRDRTTVGGAAGLERRWCGTWLGGSTASCLPGRPRLGLGLQSAAVSPWKPRHAWPAAGSILSLPHRRRGFVSARPTLT